MFGGNVIKIVNMSSKGLLKIEQQGKNKEMYVLNVNLIKIDKVNYHIKDTIGV